MKIVIDIPEEVYEEIMDGIEDAGVAGVPLGDLAIGFMNGTVLPKGHGALKDADKLAVAIAMMRDRGNYYGNEYEQGLFQAYDVCVDEIVDAQTIIEADKEDDDADNN